MANLYYVLSIKHSRGRDGVLMWWGPSNLDYYFRLEQAGKYTEEAIRAERAYYNNGVSTVAIPCDVVESLAIRVGDCKSRSVDRRNLEERVVEYKHLKKLVSQKFVEA